MMKQQTDTTAKNDRIPPILFIIFNRPETSNRVFQAIRRVQPPKLYIAADGPRKNNSRDELKCEETRQIIKTIDWDCEVHTLLRDENLGCGPGVSSAITWFFENEPEGIILEDDCLPSQTFFKFCSELLEKFRDDTRVMEIGGNNFEKPNDREKKYSYRFSNLTQIWGWATWRRAWNFFDFNMGHYKEIKEKKYIENYYNSIAEREFFEYIFKKMYGGDEQTNTKYTWDYQWQFACHIHSGLTVVPNQNLVQNIGFGENATHTTNHNGVGRNSELDEMDFPLTHPDFVMINRSRDERNFKIMHTSPWFILKSYTKQIIPKSILEKLIKPVRNRLLNNQSTVDNKSWRPEEIQDHV